MKRVNVFNLVGLDKDIMVESFIYHDIGKVQPDLRIGDLVNPREVFEPSMLHAIRSAELCKHYYGVDPEVEAIIRYHHTAEDELPSSFPAHLKPMWRLFRLVDGLSAGLTRRGARLSKLTMKDSWLSITESNPDVRYNRSYRISLYTGLEEPLESHFKEHIQFC